MKKPKIKQLSLFNAIVEHEVQKKLKELKEKENATKTKSTTTK